MKRYYILHYFDPANVGSFLLVSLLGLILVLALVLLIAKLQIQRQLKDPEPPLTPSPTQEDTGNRRATPGSISFVPPVAGLLIAGEIVREICGVG